MKNILKILFLILPLLVISSKRVSATEQPILFWGTTCPYCEIVKNSIVEQGLDKKIDIVQLEIYENADNVEILKEKVGICGIDSNSVPIPMLFVENKCFTGVDPILQQLNNIANGVSIDDGTISDINIDGKKNTEKLIISLAIFLIVLPLFGSFVKRIKKDDENNTDSKEIVKNSKKGKKFLPILFLSILPLIFTSPVKAFCPVCTVAIGAGVGFSRYLGIDDTIAGVWIGGFILSSLLWIFNWIDGKFKKKRSNIFNIATTIVTYTIVLVPLVLSGMIGHELNKLWGIDKVLLGIIVGTVAFYIAQKIHFYIKMKMNDKVLFPFQKVVIPVFFLLISTIIFYLIVYY